MWLESRVTSDAETSHVLREKMELGISNDLNGQDPT